MSNKVLVKFNRPWAAYSRNDIAGFDAKTAEALVDANVAELYEDTDTGATDTPTESGPPPKKGGDKNGAGNK